MVIIVAVFLVWHAKRAESRRQDPGGSEDGGTFELTEMKMPRVGAVLRPESAPDVDATPVTSALHGDMEA